MLNAFDKALVDILSLNSAYQLDFSTAKQLVNKLSSEPMKEKYSSALDDVRDENEDSHNMDNYIKTVQDIISMARIKIDEKFDGEVIDQHSRGEPEWKPNNRNFGPHANLNAIHLNNGGYAQRGYNHGQSGGYQGDSQRGYNHGQRGGYQN